MSAHAGLYRNWEAWTLKISRAARRTAWIAKRGLLASAGEKALKHVNQYLRAERYPRLTSLAQLTVFCDVPCQRMEPFIHFDEGFAWLVNRILARYPVPIPVRGVRGEPVLETGDADAREIAGTIDLDVVFSFFTEPKVAHLMSLVEVAEGGQIVQLQNLLIDQKVAAMLREIRFPLELNNTESDIALEIWRQLRLQSVVAGLPPVIRALDQYEVVDNQWFIGLDAIKTQVDVSLSAPLPIVKNRLPRWAARAIVKDNEIVSDVVGSITGFSPVKRSTMPVDVFEITDQTIWVLSIDFVGYLLDREREKLPVRANVPSRRNVKTIARKFNDVCAYDGYRIEAPPLLGYFREKETALYGSLAAQTVTSAICMDILWPIGPNVAEHDVVQAISAAVESFTDLSEFAAISSSVFENTDPRDPVFYGNPQDVFDSRCDIWGALPLPVICNSATDIQLFAMTDSESTYTVKPFVSQVCRSLENFELDDTHLYTGDTLVVDYIDKILAEFDPGLPLAPNTLPHGLGEAVVAPLDFFSYSPEPIDKDRFLRVYRRITLTQRPLAETLFRDIQPRLPIASNACDVQTVDDILTCIEEAASRLLYPLDLADVAPLGAYHAPGEVEEDVDSIVYGLVRLILAADVVPFVPVLEDIHGQEWEIVIDDLISAPVLVSDAFAYGSDAFSVQRISYISGPLPDRPVLITADDIVGKLLWNVLLPELPVRPSEVDEMISDELDKLDELDVRSGDLGSEEEPLPEEIEQMLIYRPKRAIRVEE
jgi:hypothetical protein